MNIYQSSNYRKDFQWLHFDNEPRVQKEAAKVGGTVLHNRFCNLFNISTYKLRVLTQDMEQVVYNAQARKNKKQIHVKKISYISGNGTF